MTAFGLSEYVAPLGKVKYVKWGTKEKRVPLASRRSFAALADPRMRVGWPITVMATISPFGA